MGASACRPSQVIEDLCTLHCSRLMASWCSLPQRTSRRKSGLPHLARACRPSQVMKDLCALQCSRHCRWHSPLNSAQMDTHIQTSRICQWFILRRTLILQNFNETRFTLTVCCTFYRFHILCQRTPMSFTALIGYCLFSHGCWPPGPERP